MLKKMKVEQIQMMYKDVGVDVEEDDAREQWLAL